MPSCARGRGRAEEAVDGVGSPVTPRHRIAAGEVTGAVAHRVARVGRVQAVLVRGRVSLNNDALCLRRSGHRRGSCVGRGCRGDLGLREGHGLQELFFLGEMNQFADGVLDDQILVLALVSVKALALRASVLRPRDRSASKSPDAPCTTS